MAYFDTTSAGALISHLSSDTDKVGALRDIIPAIAGPIAQVVYGGFVLFRISWELTIVVFTLLASEFVESSIRFAITFSLVS